MEPARLLGCLLLRSPGDAVARGVGAAVGVLIGTFVLPALYAVAFEALRRADALTGLLLAIPHAVLAGIGLAAAGRSQRCARAISPWPPGLFGWRFGPFTPPALVVALLFYGALLGFVYVVPPR